MKRAWIIVLLSLLMIPLLAQRDPTIPDTIDHQVANQASWYNDTLPGDLGPPKDSVLLVPADLPAKLTAALAAKDEYAGWDKGKIYYDRASKIYKIYIADDTNVRVYGFSPTGHPVSFRSFKRKL